MRSKFRVSFLNTNTLSDLYDVPEEMIYEKMITVLAKAFSQCKYYVAEKYTETDFWELLCFENLDTEIQNQLSKPK